MSGYWTVFYLCSIPLKESISVFPEIPIQKTVAFNTLLVDYVDALSDF